MRIGIDATCLPPVAAGASRYVTGLLNGLAQVDARHEYFVFLKAKHRGLAESFPANMQPVILPNFPRPVRMAYQHFFAGPHAQRLRLDLWHGTHYGVPLFTRRLALVSTFHDLSVVEFPSYFAAARRVYFQRALADAARRAEMIVCVSHATRQALQKHFPVNGHAVTVHSGVEPIFFQRLSDEAIDRACRIRNIQRPYVLFLSTLERHKNLPLAIHAFAAVRRHCRDNLQLVIAGQLGNGWPETSALIRKLGLTEAVRVLGYVAEPALPALYQGARLLVLPSIVEGFGFPLLEAMAGGVPVLAAQPVGDHNSASTELVSHPAMLCERDVEQWAARMEKLIYDAPLRREVSAYAVERAGQFSWNATAQRMVEIYETAGLPPSPLTILPLDGMSGVAGAPAEKKNGAAHHHAGEQAIAPPGLVGAVLRTLVYADLFDYPLLLHEAHLGLLDCAAEPDEVSTALARLRRERLIDCTGEWWHLAERAAIVDERRRRGELTRKLWRDNAGLLKLVCRFPFVKGVALSGAGSFENCQPSLPRCDGKLGKRSRGGADDIDLFIIADERRLWLTYAALAFLLKAIGKRRLICLNYLIGHEDLAIPPGRDRDFFVAHQIAFLRPLRGRDIFEKFFRANRWIHQHLPQTASQSPAPPAGLPVAPETPWPGQSFIERIFGARLFDFLERFIYRLYSRHILRIAGHHGERAIQVTPSRIKLFTTNHRYRLTETLEKRFEMIWKNHRNTIDSIDIHTSS